MTLSGNYLVWQHNSIDIWKVLVIWTAYMHCEQLIHKTTNMSTKPQTLHVEFEVWCSYLLFCVSAVHSACMLFKWPVPSICLCCYAAKPNNYHLKSLFEKLKECFYLNLSIILTCMRRHHDCKGAIWMASYILFYQFLLVKIGKVVSECWQSGNWQSEIEKVGIDELRIE